MDSFAEYLAQDAGLSSSDYYEEYIELYEGPSTEDDPDPNGPFGL